MRSLALENTSDGDDLEDLSKGHVRHLEQARPLGKSIPSERLNKHEDSEPLSRPVPSEPLNGGFVE